MTLDTAVSLLTYKTLHFCYVGQLELKCVLQKLPPLCHLPLLSFPPAVVFTSLTSKYLFELTGIKKV